MAKSRLQELSQGFIRDQKVIDELLQSSDRSKVILGGAIIDELLNRVLSKNLVNDEDLLKNALDPAGFLGTYASKCKICYLSGFISKELYDDLYILGRIRNHFAHHILNCDFGNQSMASLVNNFTVAKEGLKVIVKETDTSEKFALEIILLEILLVKTITRSAPKEKKLHSVDFAFEGIDMEYLEGQ